MSTTARQGRPRRPAQTPTLRPTSPAALARYTDGHGHKHRIETHPTRGGAALVIDQAETDGVRRLVGRFDPDEPHAAIDALIADYVARAELGTLPLARQVAAEDLR